MRILFDQGVPVPPRRHLTGHDVATAHEEGLSAVGNGELLRRADARFDLLITTDKNLRHQQNLSGLRLAVVVLPTTSWSKIRKNLNKIAAALDNVSPGEFHLLEFRPE